MWEQIRLRVAQYFVLVVLGFGGIFAADSIGLIGVGVFDWDYGLDPDISRVVRRFNGVVYGAFATLPMLIVGRMFVIKELPIFATTTILGTAFFLLGILRTRGPLFSDYDTSLQFLIPPYIVGSFASIGAMLVLCKVWSVLAIAMKS